VHEKHENIYCLNINHIFVIYDQDGLEIAQRKSIWEKSLRFRFPSLYRGVINEEEKIALGA